jgi:hypothetical protein
MHTMYHTGGRRGMHGLYACAMGGPFVSRGEIRVCPVVPARNSISRSVKDGRLQ